MIKPLQLTQIAEATKGRLLGEDLAISSISIDSRSIQEGDLFVALKGDHFDGHKYVSAAQESGCSALIVEDDKDCNCSAIVVDDSRTALAQIAGLNRDNFKGKLVGITGSSGKTTVKNMLDSVLSQAGKTHATKGNFNNEIGVPLTLLALETEHEYAVVEMGARQIGDIAYLGQFVSPDVSILLNVGNAHIDIFGSYENIVQAKSEIFDALGPDGIAVVNIDDAAAETWKSMNKDRKMVCFSAQSNQADVWAEVIEYQQEGSYFKLCVRGDSVSVALPMPGHHNVLNSLATAAAAIAVGLTLEQIKDGLESAANDSGRLHVLDLVSGTRLIDDSYNANPSSMKAALDVLALYKGRKIAVLGEMAELGDFSERLHLQVAEHALGLGIDMFLLVGEHASLMVEKLGDRAISFSDKAALGAHLVSELVGNETVLIKGSRSAGMDEIVAQLTEANT